MKLDLKKWNLNALIYFNEVARLGSVTRAASALRISQPAVTRMIKQLEYDLGVQLFKKVGRGIEMTEKGNYLANRTQAWLGDANRIRQELDAEKFDLKFFDHPAELRIGASDHLAIYVLPSLITKMSKKFKNLSWNIYSGVGTAIKEKLIKNEIDAGIFYTKLTLKDQSILQEMPICKVEFSIVVSPKLKKGPVTIEWLKNNNVTYIGARMDDYSSSAAEQWIYKRVGLNPKHSIQANVKEIQKALTVEGLGYSVLPKLMIKQELRQKKLVEVKVNPDLLKYELSWVTMKSQASPRVLQALREEYLKPQMTQLLSEFR